MSMNNLSWPRKKAMEGIAEITSTHAIDESIPTFFWPSQASILRLKDYTKPAEVGPIS